MSLTGTPPRARSRRRSVGARSSPTERSGALAHRPQPEARPRIELPDADPGAVVEYAQDEAMIRVRQRNGHVPRTGLRRVDDRLANNADNVLARRRSSTTASSASTATRTPKRSSSSSATWRSAADAVGASAADRSAMAPRETASARRAAIASGWSSPASRAIRSPCAAMKARSCASPSCRSRAIRRRSSRGGAGGDRSADRRLLPERGGEDQPVRARCAAPSRAVTQPMPGVGQDEVVEADGGEHDHRCREQHGDACRHISPGRRER